LSNTKVVRLQQAPSANCAKRQPRQLDKQSDPALTGCTVSTRHNQLVSWTKCALLQLAVFAQVRLWQLVPLYLSVCSVIGNLNNVLQSSRAP
jgi:hypothetical protein